MFLSGFYRLYVYVYGPFEDGPRRSLSEGEAPLQERLEDLIAEVPREPVGDLRKRLRKRRMAYVHVS